MMHELTFLGRGSGYHITEDNTSAFYCDNRKMILIDCGETVFKTILRKKLLEQVDELYIIITHMHSDHIGSLAGLVGYFYWKYQKKANIFFPEKDNMVTFLSLQGMKQEQIYHYIDENKLEIPKLGLEISSILTEHVTTISSYSYLFRFQEGNNILYSGDSKILYKDVVSFLEEGGILYQDICISDDENGPHMTLNEIINIIPKYLRKQIYCIHVDGNQYDELTQSQGFMRVKSLK